ncbi:MAG: NADH-quinone oxidoreductase subunit N [Rickettsiales bacterium]
MYDNFDLSVLFPEFILSSVAVLIILLGVFLKKLKLEKFYLYVMAVSLVVALSFSISDFGASHVYLFNNMVESNPIKQLLKIIILGLSVFTAILLIGSSEKYREIRKFEFSSLCIFSICGSLLILSANNLIILYLGLEIQSLCLYVLATFARKNHKSSEAGVKYFILGSIASAVLLFGMSFMYGYSGTVNFTEMQKIYSALLTTNGSEVPIGFIIGFVLVIIGLLFKASAFPFHIWVPDVYQGSQLPVTAFFSIIPKVTSIFILLDFLVVNFSMWKASWSPIIMFVSVLSMFIGAFGAMIQKNMKRLLAYSSIGNVGFMIVALVSSSGHSLGSVIIYAVIYGIMNIGMFALLNIVQKKHEDYNISIFTGLAERHPMLAFSFAVILLSMAGIPPLAGFFAKFFVIKSLIVSDMYAIATVTLLASVISSFYYLKIIKSMYFETAENSDHAISIVPETMFIATFAVVANMFLVFTPSSIINFTSLQISLIP